MKTWKELFEDNLSEMEMLKIRGGDGDENPDKPIVKGE